MNEYFNINDRRIDTAKVISVLLNVLLLFTTGLFAWLYFAKPCPPCTDGEVLSIQRDTIWSYTALQPVAVEPPVAIKTVKLKKEKPKVSNSIPSLLDFTDTAQFLFQELQGRFPLSTEPSIINNQPSIEESPCDFVNFYADTIYTTLGGEQVPQAAIYYQVQGTLLSREIWQSDVQTQVKETRQMLHREKWKLYVGVTGKISNSLKGWGVGPTGSMAIPKVGLVSYGYDVRNHDHLIGFSALIRFKK